MPAAHVSKASPEEFFVSGVVPQVTIEIADRTGWWFLVLKDPISYGYFQA
jgi:hypothetical protein